MKDPLTQKLPRQPLITLILLLCLGTGPHIWHLSPWLMGFFFLLAILRLVMVQRSGALPGHILLFLLSMGGVVNVALHQASPLGMTTAVGLLTTMLGLKLMELRTQRDIYITVLLGFFVIITQFLYERGMAMAFFLALVVVGLIAVLVAINQARPTTNPLFPLRKALIMVGQSLPIMIAMFLLFPRLSGPLWNLGVDEESAITGLSDTISPGSISNLSQSRAVAFRVQFRGEAPPPETRYWRGPVLWDTDGRTWSTGNFSTIWAPGFRPIGDAISYEITLEPTRQRWLFTLDLPVKLPPKVEVLPDFQVLAKEPINRVVRYWLRSNTEYITGELKPEERERGLALPPNITPRMRQLVYGWQEQDPNKAAIVTAALRHFNEQEFIYTLSPPLLINNPADEFLFETRRGFCEHFATSFTLLMRIAGIPARVVAGYQGGEFNPRGDYYIVRQSDAHAWTEVWLQDRGWVRIDPTAAVAPERIEHAIEPQALSMGAPVRFQLGASGPLTNLLRQLRWGLDAINLSWQRWILDYTDTRQSALLSMLGLGFLKGKALGVGMVAITALAVALITFGILRQGGSRDPIFRLYQQFCNKLARHGLARKPSEGPLDFAIRVIRMRPDLETPVKNIIQLYIGLRYGRSDTPANRRHFRRLVQGFRPRIGSSFLNR